MISLHDIVSVHRSYFHIPRSALGSDKDHTVGCHCVVS
jgi:hypothetical protein